VEGRVGSDEAAPLVERELRFSEQDEALVPGQDALDVDVLRACHASIISAFAAPHKPARAARRGELLRSGPIAGTLGGKGEPGPLGPSGGMP
jgi:hypothetical protein